MSKPVPKLKLVAFDDGDPGYSIRYLEPVAQCCEMCHQETGESDQFPGGGSSVSGSADDMREVAKAIRERGAFSAYRVSVRYGGKKASHCGGHIASHFIFGMPRDGEYASVSIDDADDIATQIERIVR